jgi:hypothetical protein
MFKSFFGEFKLVLGEIVVHDDIGFEWFKNYVI